MGKHSTATEKLASAKSMLREATQDLHQRLHKNPLLRGLSSEEVTLSAYQRILEAFLGFYRPLEPQLVSASIRLHCAEAYRDNVRTKWIAEDLRNLGYSPEVIDSFPNNDEPLTIVTRADLAGCLYVIEGSTLGGTGIARSLIESLGLNARRGVRFFSGYEEGTGSNWKRVCDFVESSCTASDERDRADELAQQTFASLDSWLLRCAEVC